MERHREVFEDRSVTRILIEDSMLGRFAKRTNQWPVHVLSGRDNVILDINYGDVLVGSQTILNKDIPSIIARFRESYKDEIIYMLIWLIGPEDMSRVGFCSSREPLAFNPYGNLKGFDEEIRTCGHQDGPEIVSIEDKCPVTDKDIEKTHQNDIKLENVTMKAEILYCSGCLGIIDESQESCHCDICGLAVHDSCKKQVDSKTVCDSCSRFDGNKVLTKLRVSCASMVHDSPTMKDGEKETFYILIRRAKDLKDLQKISSRFELTSLNTVPELSRRDLHVEDLRQIFKDEIKRYRRRVIEAIKAGNELPSRPTNVLEFVMKHPNMDKDTIVEFVKYITSPAWLGGIVMTGVRASAAMFEKNYMYEDFENHDKGVVKRVEGDAKGARCETLFVESNVGETGRVIE